MGKDKKIATVAIMLSEDRSVVRSKYRGFKPSRVVHDHDEAVDRILAGDVAIVAKGEAARVKATVEDNL